MVGQSQKKIQPGTGPGTGTQEDTFFAIFGNFFLLFYNWPNFITRLCLLPKLFSKMYFLFQV